MTQKSNFPWVEATLAGMVLFVTYIVFVVMRNKAKSRRDTLAKLRGMINENIGIHGKDDFNTKYQNVQPDTSYNASEGIKKLKGYDGYLRNDNEGILNYLRSLNINQMKALKDAFEKEEGTTIDEWLSEILTGFKSNCSFFWSGCDDYDKAIKIIQGK